MRKVIWNQNRFKVGDKVKYSEEFKTFLTTQPSDNKVHTVTETVFPKTNATATSGQWIKISNPLVDHWIDSHWFIKWGWLQRILNIK